jgi:hypothetical protein
MISRSARFAALVLIPASLLGGCARGQLDLRGKGLEDPYGSTRP